MRFAHVRITTCSLNNNLRRTNGSHYALDTTTSYVVRFFEMRTNENCITRRRGAATDSVASDLRKFRAKRRERASRTDVLPAMGRPRWPRSDVTKISSRVRIEIFSCEFRPAVVFYRIKIGRFCYGSRFFRVCFTTVFFSSFFCRDFFRAVKLR